MNSFTIPVPWSPFISADTNRVFINPANGCKANCAYCYIFDYGHPHRAEIFDRSGEEIQDWLLSQSGFRQGKNGTLLSIGSSCDPFDSEVTSKTLEICKALAKLENPVQISTKYQVDKESARTLSRMQNAYGQIVVYSTITSFRFWEKLEPAAHSPAKRLAGLLDLRRSGIATCLYVKPVLPGITENEIDLFAQALNEYEIPYCTLGLMYTSASIEGKLNKRSVATEELVRRLGTRGKIPPPSKQNEPNRHVVDLETLDIIKKMIEHLQMSNVECVISGPCVVALAYNVACPTGIWHSRPHLCIKCRADCKSKYENQYTRIGVDCQ